MWNVELCEVRESGHGRNEKVDALTCQELLVVLDFFFAYSCDIPIRFLTCKVKVPMLKTTLEINNIVICAFISQTARRIGLTSRKVMVMTLQVVCMVENSDCPSFYVIRATTPIARKNLYHPFELSQATDAMAFVGAVWDTPTVMAQFIVHREGVLSCGHLSRFYH